MQQRNKIKLVKLPIIKLKSMNFFTYLGSYCKSTQIIELFIDDIINNQNYIPSYWTSNIEESIAHVLNHEMMHHILHIEHGKKVCNYYDNIAVNLRENGINS